MLVTKIRCPMCGHVQEIEVPENACLPFYKCNGCGELIQTPTDTCCVICAYSETKCPASSLR
ncbi:MAG: hypothetical protein E3J80_00720 [Hadesarchaea archaeon]|nr:MAG: hypothetical protein E3J80_00720 [Hadesarchaea archaeon]